jgi:hypothetical protein
MAAGRRAEPGRFSHPAKCCVHFVEEKWNRFHFWVFWEYNPTRLYPTFHNGFCQRYAGIMSKEIAGEDWIGSRGGIEHDLRHCLVFFIVCAGTGYAANRTDY